VRYAALAEHNNDAEFDLGLEALLDRSAKLELADDVGVRGRGKARA
jgi:hypothetical protein